MGRIEESSVDVGGVATFFRRTEGEGMPTVFVHGHPTSSDDWLPFMEQLGGPALALDSPAGGARERPEGFDYTMAASRRTSGASSMRSGSATITSSSTTGAR